MQKPFFLVTVLASTLTLAAAALTLSPAVCAQQGQTGTAQEARAMLEDVRTLKDPAGTTYGQELYAAAQKPEGQITEVSYVFPKPGTTAPAVPKVSFVTKAGDLGCGVGYYK